METTGQASQPKAKVDNHNPVAVKTGNKEIEVKIEPASKKQIARSSSTNVKEVVAPTFAASPAKTTAYPHLPDIPDGLEKIYRKVYAPRKTPALTTTPTKSRYSQTNMPSPYMFPPKDDKKKLPLPTLKQVQKAIPPKASSVFHVLDRRINFDSFPPDVSLYSLLRAWVKDDPYVAQNQFNLFQYVSLPSQRRDINSHKIGTRSYFSNRKRKRDNCNILSVIKENNTQEQSSSSHQENKYGRFDLLAEHISHAINIRKKYRRELTKDCKEIEKTEFFKDLLTRKESSNK